MITLLTLITCAIIASIIGSKKGMAGTGFFLGLLLGPLGILFVWVTKGNRQRCVSCKELIHPEASICPFCRTALKSVRSDGSSKIEWGSD